MAKKTENTVVEDVPEKLSRTNHLVKLSKDDKTVEAHPTQVALWESQGWVSE